MNTVRNVFFAALTAVVLSAGSVSGMDFPSMLKNAQTSSTTAPLGFAVAGSVLNRNGYAKEGDRCSKAALVAGFYAATSTGTYKGSTVAAVTDVVLHEAFERVANTQVGQTVAGYLPEFAKSDVAQEVVCGLVAVAAGYKADQLAKAESFRR